ELLVKDLDALGTEAGNAQQIEQSGRQLRRQLFPKRQLAGRDDIADLLGQIFADAGDLGQVFGRRAHQLGDRLRKIAYGAGRVAVGAHPERVRALDLEEIRHFVEQAGDVGVLHRQSVEDGRRREKTVEVKTVL